MKNPLRRGKGKAGSKRLKQKVTSPPSPRIVPVEMCKTLTSFTQFNRHNPHPIHPSDFLSYLRERKRTNREYLYAAAFIINEFFAIFALFFPTEPSCSHAGDQWEFIIQ